MKTRSSALVVLLLTACGLGGGGFSLDGREFLSTSVTDDGAAHPLVPGTQIRLGFHDGQITASAGCNTIGGSYRLEGGALLFEGGGMTEMGCDEARMAQDEWLSAFLSSRPALAIDGNDLRLTSNGTAISLLDGEVAEPDLPLVGTTWTVDSIISGDAVSSVADGSTATLTFSSDGRVEVNTGCNTGSGRFEATDDGQLRFVDVAVTEMACAGPGGALEAAVLPVLGADGITFAVDAGRLTLMAGDHGLSLTGS